MTWNLVNIGGSYGRMLLAIWVFLFAGQEADMACLKDLLLIFLRRWLACLLLNNDRLPLVLEVTIQNDSFVLPRIRH